MGNPLYKPGDTIYLISDKSGSYPLVIESYSPPYVDVVYLSINEKTKMAEVRKSRLHEKTITPSINPGEEVVEA